MDNDKLHKKWYRDDKEIKIAFVSNMCTHYTIRLFELLSKKYKVDFLFTGGHEDYWDKENKLWLGKFNGRYLKGFFILPKIKITPELFGLFFKGHDIFIKTIVDRFALVFVFFLAKIQRKPFILWTEMWSHPSTLFHKFSFVFMRFIYKHSDAIIAYGDHVKRYLISLCIPDDKIFCAYQSVDNDAFNCLVTDEEKKELRYKLGLFNEKIILYVGRLEECKGIGFLIEAISLIKDQNVRTVFIGTGSKKTYFEGKCKELNVRYLFLGHIPNNDLYRYYSIARAFVIPSITTQNVKEPWGMVVNEAMNQSCPVIATDVVGAAVSGLVEDGENGFIIPERDSAELQIAIEALVKDDKLFAHMAKTSKEKIKIWTPSRTVDGFSQAIDYALKRKRR